MRCITDCQQATKCVSFKRVLRNRNPNRFADKSQCPARCFTQPSQSCSKHFSTALCERIGRIGRQGPDQTDSMLAIAIREWQKRQRALLSKNLKCLSVMWLLAVKCSHQRPLMISTIKPFESGCLSRCCLPTFRKDHEIRIDRLAILEDDASLWIHSCDRLLLALNGAPPNGF